MLQSAEVNVKATEKAEEETEWILCPDCHCKTRIKVYPKTILVNLPLYCPKCKHEFCISAVGTTLV